MNGCPAGRKHPRRFICGNTSMLPPAAGLGSEKSSPGSEAEPGLCQIAQARRQGDQLARQRKISLNTSAVWKSSVFSS